MTFALDTVNDMVRRGKKRIALDGYIIDSCSNGFSAIDATLRMMRIAAPIAGAPQVNALSVSSLCELALRLSGLVGASYSSVSLAVSSVLQTYNVTMLSYASTAIELEDKQKHPLFARLVPSDVGQAMVVYDLAKSLGWNTVEMLTAANSDYSKSLAAEFARLVAVEKSLVVCQTHEYMKMNQPAFRKCIRL